MLLPVDQLNIKLLQEAVDAMASAYYPVKDIKALLAHLYKRAVAEGWMTVNLADFIELPTLEVEELQPFNENELRGFWNAYGAGDTFVGYILLMIYTGMIPGELIRLKKAHDRLGCPEDPWLWPENEKAEGDANRFPGDHRPGAAGSVPATQEPHRERAVHDEGPLLSGVP